MIEVNFFRINKMNDMSKASMLNLLKRYPAIVYYSNEDSIAEIFISKQLTKKKDKDSDVRIVMHKEMDDEDCMYNSVELEVMPNFKKCTELSINSQKDIGYGLEDIIEMFGNESVLKWINGDTASIFKYGQTITCSSVNDFWTQYFNNDLTSVHNENARYGEDFHGELVMNKKASDVFGFDLPNEKSDDYLNDFGNSVEFLCPESTSEQDFVDAGIEFYSGYAYVTDITEYNSNVEDEHEVTKVINTIKNSDILLEFIESEKLTKEPLNKIKPLRM